MQAVERFLMTSGGRRPAGTECFTAYTRVLRWADMEETLDTTINTRVPRRVRQALEQVARERRVNPLTFARTLLRARR